MEYGMFNRILKQNTTCISMVVIIIACVNLTRCGDIDKNGERFVDAASTFGTAPTTQAANTDGSVTVTFPNGTTEVRYPTTTGGYYKMELLGDVPISSSETFAGLAADSNYYYILIRKDLGFSIVRWYFYRTAKLTDSWTQRCSILDDGKFFSYGKGWYGGMAWDGTNFYIMDGPAGSTVIPKFRKFSGTDCSEGESINTATKTAYGTLVYAYDNGYLFWDRDGDVEHLPGQETPDSGYVLFRTNVTTGGSTSFITNQTMGTKSTYWGRGIFPFSSGDTPVALTVHSGTAWSIFSIGYAKNDLWKFNSSGAAIGWSEFSVYGGFSIGSSWEYLAASGERCLATQNGTNLVFGARRIPFYEEIRFITVGVTNF
jgi:hypothetical protein